MTWNRAMAIGLTVVLAAVGGFSAFVLVPRITTYLLQMQGLV